MAPSQSFLSRKLSGNFADREANKEWGATVASTDSSDGYAFTSPIGTFSPNDRGFYDMNGNADEWCRSLTAGHYERRGGSWLNHAGDYRTIARSDSPTERQLFGTGFRVAREIDAAQP